MDALFRTHTYVLFEHPCRATAQVALRFNACLKDFCDPAVPPVLRNSALQTLTCAQPCGNMSHGVAAQ